MSLKLKRNVLERIVQEELHRFIAEQLNEAPPSRGTVLDDEQTEDELPTPGGAPEEQLPTDSPAPEAGDEMGDLPDEDTGGDELPTGEEPADDELEADVAGDEDSGAEPGSVAAELEDKTIESVSMEEDSKIMPGAMEIVLTFRENPDALRLLVTKTGKVKIFYKGLHNDFSSPVEQIPGDEDTGEELGDEELPGEDAMDLGGEEGGDEFEDMPPMGDEDMPPPPDEEEEVPLPGPPK